VFLSTGLIPLTRAQLASMDTIPVSLIAAPGANKVILPVYWYVSLSKTVASGGPAPLFRLRWSGDTTDICGNNNSALNTVPINPSKSFQQAFAPFASLYGPAGLITAAVNKAVEISFNSTPGASFQATGGVVVVYAIMPTP
jgi:hypothetical protein